MAFFIIVQLYFVCDFAFCFLTEGGTNEKHYVMHICIIHSKKSDIDDLVPDCSNSIANALELLQSCTKPSI